MKNKLMILGIVLSFSMNIWGMEQVNSDSRQDNNAAGNAEELSTNNIEELSANNNEEPLSWLYADEYFDPNSDSCITFKNLSNYFNSDL